MLRLTDEQRKLAEDNERLIYGFCRRHLLNITDFYGICAIGLCKAAATYEPGRAAFSSWAEIHMRNEVRNALRSSKGPGVISYDTAIRDEKDPPPECRTGYEQDFTRIEAQDTIRELWSQLSRRDRPIFAAIIGAPYKTQAEIAEALGLSQPTVSRAISRIRQTHRRITD